MQILISYFFKKTEVQLIYNIVLVSGNSVLFINVYIYFFHFFIIAYYKILNIVVCKSFFKKIIYLFIYLFMYVCVGSSFLCEGFLQLWQVGATLHHGARASHCRGLSCCGAQAPDAEAHQLWLTGLVAPRHGGSSQTRARTRVPCIGRQFLNHCATREAPCCLSILNIVVCIC